MSTITAPATLSLTHPVSPARPAVSILLPLWYALTLFVSATLLFLVQPMFAKMVLPLLGGTPAVWNTCMVFYQAALLVGYGYAHVLTRCLSVRWQILLHAGLLLVPLAGLPIAVSENWVPPGDSTPIPWLLALLAVSVGLPFVVVSTSAPLLQRWFAGTGHPSARDPYFLYAASNLGSMLSLLSYPLLLEPLLRLKDQSFFWTAGYGVLVVLTFGCGWLLWRVAGDGWRVAGENELTRHPPLAARHPGWWRRWHWIGLSLVPSSLMLGVTTHLTTDVAAIPLLWVLPLALYLLTFILVFSRLGPKLQPFMVQAMPMLTLLLVGVLVTGSRLPLIVDVALHLATFFVITMVCHGELARLRPAPEHLTEYYLLMSVGGVLGGLFNALIAPVCFTLVLEFPLALLAACLLKPNVAAADDKPAPVWRGVLLALFVAGYVALDNTINKNDLAARVGFWPVWLAQWLGYLTLLVVGYHQSRRSLRFAGVVAAALVVGCLCLDLEGFILKRERSFFGQVTVRHDPQREYTWLLHGTTLHGQQSLDPARQEEPLSYFHRSGPIGQLFEAFSGSQSPRTVGVTGLGIGTLAAYSQPGQAWTFYEIDPAVIQVARDTRYFAYLADCEQRGTRLDIVAGDARLQLKHATEQAYDLLFLDAFSSDSIPVHLVTRQALDLYLDKLAEDGVLIFNISNRYIDLEPVLAGLARAAGLTSYVQHDADVNGYPGKYGSSFVVMSRQASVLEKLVSNGRWLPLQERPGMALWSDDFSNLISVLKTR